MVPKVHDQTRKYLVEGVVTKLGVLTLENDVKMMSTAPYVNESRFRDVLEQHRNT